MHTPPIPGSGRAARLRKRKIKRITLFASLIVIILLLITAAILLAVQIARLSSNLPKDNNTSDTTTSTPTDTSGPVSSNTGYTAFMYDSAKMKQGPLVLVNKDHEYTFPSGLSQLMEIRSSRTKSADGNYAYSCDYDKLMDSEALTAFNKMMDAFYTSTGNGYALVTAAYRTAEEQNSLGLETKGGYSDHHTGCLVTIKFYKDGIMYDQRDASFTEDYKWLADHAHEYGFVTRYPDSKVAVTEVSNYSNAYRYVGMSHAAYMHANNLCLEEYVELLKSHNVDGSHLTVTAADGVQYEIYRIPASTAAQTSVQVPEGKQYTISGDNDGGLIVSVKLN
ncbi:MAG: D-alanyl-D-alanine carboxypeptidase family protein [Clostridia bacterium]|nr:D-alanyl-D-alanine carboxypeptidase family protein [Clostridia bacterium]